MGQKTIWHEHTYVRSSETDFLTRWKLSSFFAAMVEAAAHHADSLGFGFYEMMGRETIWVLSRLKIRFFQFPRIEEKITIETWPKGLQQKIFFMRDYHVLADDGSRLASATSAYILVNPRIRRMLPPQALDGSVPDNDGLSALDEVLDKIPPAVPLEERLVARADYSAVDLMGHVNNTRYIDWLSDCFSFTEHQAMQPAWLQINYINEVKPGEVVTIQRAPYPEPEHAWFLTGTNLTTGTKAFDAQIGWAIHG
jgi:medium-chain acyl-[acyl-carrier-protein] hydrolase